MAGPLTLAQETTVRFRIRQRLVSRDRQVNKGRRGACAASDSSQWKHSRITSRDGMVFSMIARSALIPRNAGEGRSSFTGCQILNVWKGMDQVSCFVAGSLVWIVLIVAGILFCRGRRPR